MKNKTKWTIGILVVLIVVVGAIVGTSKFSKGKLEDFPKPNLWFVPNSLRDDVRGIATLTVMNNGMANAGPFYIRTIHTNSSFAEPIPVRWRYFEGLAPGSSIEIQPSEADVAHTVDFGVFLDATKVIFEDDEKDNVFWWVNPAHPPVTASSL